MNVIKKAKGTKKCVIKKHLNFDLYKQSLFKIDYHNIYTQTVNKTALNNNDNKRIILFDVITMYSHGINKSLLDKLETSIKSNPIQLYY